MKKKSNYISLKKKNYTKTKFVISKKINYFNIFIKSINLFFIVFLLVKVYYQEKRITFLEYLIKEKILNNEKNKNNEKFSKIDADMVGIKYPEISFNKIKTNIINKKIINSLLEFMEQLEEKIIYLEKEINVTKLNSFFTTRVLYLNKIKVNYDDTNVKELHNIINWLVIHKSTQLKGIASDKYLACKYVKKKLGKDLCTQRIGVYDNVEEINFEELIKKGNVILKISNGCHDTVYIHKNTKENATLLKEKVNNYYNRDYGLMIPEFFHLYSKKRIILEELFEPFSDLYEFKFFLINNKIKFILLLKTINGKNFNIFYDPNFVLLAFSETKSFNINSEIEIKKLNELKEYAIKLSEDFQNFIRVDLYLFHNKIYLSELTFDSNSGRPFYANEKIVIDAGNDWKIIE